MIHNGRVNIRLRSPRCTECVNVTLLVPGNIDPATISHALLRREPRDCRESDCLLRTPNATHHVLTHRYQSRALPAVSITVDGSLTNVIVTTETAAAERIAGTIRSARLLPPPFTIGLWTPDGPGSRSVRWTRVFPMGTLPPEFQDPTITPPIEESIRNPPRGGDDPE